MHSFKFIQKCDVALGCECLLDGQPLKCESFKLIASTGNVTILEARLFVNNVEMEADELDVVNSEDKNKEKEIEVEKMQPGIVVNIHATDQSIDLKKLAKDISAEIGRNIKRI